MQAMEPGFSALGGGLFGVNWPSGLTINRFVCTDTPGTVPRVLAGAMTLSWAKLLIDRSMITNVAISNTFLFIYISLLFCSLNYVVRAVADTGASRLKVEEMPYRCRKRPIGRLRLAVLCHSIQRRLLYLWSHCEHSQMMVSTRACRKKSCSKIPPAPSS